MSSLPTRVLSRLYHHTPKDDGDAPAPETLHCPRWLAAAIGVAVILIAAVTVAISLTSGDNSELASAGTTEATTTTTPTSDSAPTSVSEATTPTTTDGPTDSPTTATGPAPTPPTPSAADDLAAFFAAADRVDQRLEAAADQFNATVGPDTVRVDEALRESVKSTNTSEAAAAIPPGLPPDVLLKVLIVQDDLATRAAALRGAVDEVNAGQMEAALNCLKNSGVKAARFDSDVAAAKALARSSAPIAVAAPDSRAAGELALRLSIIYALNGGCGACGNESSPVELVTITWYDQPDVDPESGFGYSGTVDLDGSGDPLRFSATYTPGAGWEAYPIAC